MQAAIFYARKMLQPAVDFVGTCRRLRPAVGSGLGFGLVTRVGIGLVCLSTFWNRSAAEPAALAVLPTPGQVRANPRQLRVDLRWGEDTNRVSFEVQRASQVDGPFASLPRPFPDWALHSDFLGTNGGEFFYRVRAFSTNRTGYTVVMSDWSVPVSATPKELNSEELLTEIQEASFRYFWDFGHPVSGLAREGTGYAPDFCAIGASGMGLFNIGVAVERGFISRAAGAERVAKMLRFLAEQADKFHGALPHFLNGRTGRVNPFFEGDDGADLVETSFLIQGALFAREYFNQTNSVEREIRKHANALWEGVDWTWFAHDEGERTALIWHWSPTREWQNKLRITGFNECQVVYLLALASPTYAVSPKFYRHGWLSAHFGEKRTRFGIPLELSYDFGPPLFWTHYSYLGLDPHALSYRGKSYFDHFQDLCRVQVRYAESRREDFKGYGRMWGITASKGPDGYHPFAPGQHDYGTLAPTAALSSMAYLPKESQACMLEMYQKHGDQLWGPFGFYDAFNFSRDWVTQNYLGIDVGPIAPMIENHRTGLCWRIFMKAPEIQRALQRLVTPQLSEANRSDELPRDAAKNSNQF